MFTVKNFDYDCTKKCKCLDHGDKITSALTKRSISNDKLAAYIAKVCRNFIEVKDNLGRSALHVAASVDRYEIVEWLLNSGALINGKDQESGSSALHRAIFYGCIDSAILLLRHGANLEVTDLDNRIPLQYICKFSDIQKECQMNNQLLLWGANKNYNLGICNENTISEPQFVHFFRKNNTSIASLAIGQYHSLFLDRRGNLFAVGHGTGGRLGINSEDSLTIPKKVKVPIKNSNEKIIQLSVSANHSIILTNHSSVFVCGSNEYQQLGFKPIPEKFLTFKEIPTFTQSNVKDICGVIANEFFSIAFTKTEFYFWGQNNGQIGSNNSEFITLPKKISVPDNSKIQCIEAHKYALAISTTSKQILLYYNYKVRSIRPPLLEAIKSISMIAEAPQQSTSKLSNLKLLMLSDTNVLYIWYDNMQQYLRCSFAIHRLTEIDKVIYRKEQVLILSKGDVYLGKCNKVPVSKVVEDSADAWHSSNHSKKDICTTHKIRIELKHFLNIDRAVDVFTDDDFGSFAVLEEHSKKYFQLPKLISQNYNFKKLYNDASEFDNVHDLVFHVDDEHFYAHKFIVFARCAGLKEIVEKFLHKDIYLNFENLTGKMFEIILKHIYYGYFFISDDIANMQSSLGSEFKGDFQDVCSIFIKFLHQFRLDILAEYAQRTFLMSKSFDKSKLHLNQVTRSLLPELYDLIIECADNKIIKAHKCILVNCLEYFDLMFSHNWAETTRISLTTLPIEYVEPMIDFLYTSDVEYFRKQNYTEYFLYNMIVICDQFFINQLRKVCEILLLEKISIKKCGEMFEFACTYNCEILKTSCLDFICQNLSRLLLQKCLENCTPEYLGFIRQHYRQSFKKVFDYRMITPDADAANDEFIMNFTNDFVVDLNMKIEENNANIKPKLKVRENKSKISLRQYELNGISVLKESGNIIEQQNHLNSKPKTPEIFNEIKEINAKLLNKSNEWTKVSDKKDTMKKHVVGSPWQMNNILSQESKPKEMFVKINDLKDNSDSYNGYNLDISASMKIDIKLSQKERKRLSSESKNSPKTPPTTTTTTISSPISQSSPLNIPIKQNAWGDIKSPDNQKFSLADIMKSPDTFKKSLSPEKKTSLSKSIEKSPSVSGTIPKVIKSPSSFSQIQHEEKLQRDYYEKIKHKSLALTQIEELAIDELKKFYNVDNCQDEVITIERKSIPTTMNFAIWQKN